MSETITETENPEPQEPAGETPEPAEAEAQEQEEFKSEESKKAVLADLAKEREAKRELQAKVKQFEEAQAEAEKAKLSDIERAQTEAQEAMSRAEKAEKELLRVSIASTHGITDKDDIELFLTGSDEETLTKQAKRLADRNSGPANPKPDPSQGTRGQENNATEAEKAAAAEQSGDYQAAGALKARQLGALSRQMSS